MVELTTRQKIAAMKSSALFSALPETAISDFLARCPARRHRAGGTLFMPTAKAECFFVILAGRVKVFQLSSRGQEQILHLYGPGDTIGEAAMWAGVNYPAHGKATAETVVLAVSRKALTDAIARDPELAVGMLVGMSAKLR